MQKLGWNDQWEDNYGAQVFPTFEDLSYHFRMCEEGGFEHLNVPVWLTYEPDPAESGLQEPVLVIGVLLTRHGSPVQWIGPATPEQVRDIQSRMLRVWAGRADAMFDRYNSRYANVS